MADGFAAINHWDQTMAPHKGNAVIGFAGGGGSSVAYKMATGQDPGACFNHWLLAVLAHQRHFPATEHHCADAFDVDPMAVLPGEPINFGWFSPDCTDFSKAKGGAPRSERIRGLAWSVIPWAKFRRIRVIMLENVEEFAQWGPVYREGLKKGEPIPARRSETFNRWKSRLEHLGYVVEWKVLNAADYGAPTTRKRLYLIARCDGEAIVWPDRTHAPRKDAERLGLKPWRGACEIIDWSIDCPSLFLEPAEVEQLRKLTGKRVNRPLVPATLRRVARGMERYVIGSADPFIVPITQKGWGGDRAHGVRDPLKTITSARGGEFAAVDPSVAMLSNAYGSNTRGGRADPNEPTKTQVSAGHTSVVTASLASVAHGEEDRAWDVEDPARTQTGHHDKALVTGSVVKFQENSTFSDPQEPLHTVMAGAPRHGVVTGSLVPRYGERAGQAPRAIDIEEPVPTPVPTGNQGSLAAATLVRQFGTGSSADAEEPAPTVMPAGQGKTQVVTAYMAQGNADRIGREADDPTTTQTERGTQQQLVAAHLDTYYQSGSIGSAPADPARTATAKARMSLVATWLEQANTGMTGHDARVPVSTIVSGGGPDSGWGPTQRLVQARLEQDGGDVGRRGKVLEFLWAHFGLPTEAEWLDPAATLEGRKKFGLVLIKGAVWMIVDIGLRMLTPEELAAAMGLPAEFNLSVDVNGKPISKTNQTQMIGNMVSPPPAAALIAANCPWLNQNEQRRAA